jgi:hypothetical protein
MSLKVKYYGMIALLVLGLTFLGGIIYHSMEKARCVECDGLFSDTRVKDGFAHTGCLLQKKN